MLINGELSALNTELSTLTGTVLATLLTGTGESVVTDSVAVVLAAEVDVELLPPPPPPQAVNNKLSVKALNVKK